jgi:hypothetical protein
MSIKGRITIEGGCFCGAVRFRGTLYPVGICHCHCEDCRRASGAPFVTWACFERNDFQITAGLPRQHLKNERIRSFCQDCGTQLFWLFTENWPFLCATVGSFDDPRQVTSEVHIWTEDKLPWICIGDDLPFHARDALPAPHTTRRPELRIVVSLMFAK